MLFIIFASCPVNLFAVLGINYKIIHFMIDRNVIYWQLKQGDTQLLVGLT